MIEDDPSNTCGRGGAGDLREGGPSGGLEHNRVGARRSGTLNELQQLLALRQAVIVGVNNFQVDAQTASRLLRGCCLFLLVVVIVVRQ